MELSFVKLNPTQNMTILVESPVPQTQRIKVATALMAYDHVFAEQVGFLEPPVSREAQGRLQMMAGEFCGNATMGLAALLAWERHIPPGDTMEIPLESSGAEGVLLCRVEAREGYLRGTVPMPPPHAIEEQTFRLNNRDYTATVVRMNGIAHIVLPDEQVQGDRKDFGEQAIGPWGDLLGDDALGLILYNRETGRIDPLVRVSSVGSLVWERGCGSGTAAVGAALAYAARGDIRAGISQPGGVIHVEAVWRNNAVCGLSITGNVIISARGTAYL